MLSLCDRNYCLFEHKLKRFSHLIEEYPLGCTTSYQVVRFIHLGETLFGEAAQRFQVRTIDKTEH